MTGLLPLGEAQRRMIAQACSTDYETLSIIDAHGRYLAKDLTALRSQPVADMSAMDGYAVRSDDLTGPWHIIGECQAGSAPCTPLQSGQCARIFTGALLPENAGAVIMQEHIRLTDTAIEMTVNETLEPGINIRRGGSDFGEGQSVLKKGDFLSPGALGLAAMAGYGEISVHKRPKIAIISTGNELIAPGQPAAPHQIPSSNDVMIAAMLGKLPAVITPQARLPDDRDKIATAFRNVAGHDLIITIGGASVGDHDLVSPALEDAGGGVDFWKIAMKPGKPLIFGKLGNALVLGLPGNPASAFVTATLFAVPLIKYLAGARDYMPLYHSAATTQPLPATTSRAEFLRAHVTEGEITPYDSRDSAKLTTLAQANALLYRPAGAKALPKGAGVSYLLI